MNWFIDCITKNYANFNGRARRKEYWMFILFDFLFNIIADLIFGNFGEIGDSPIRIIHIIWLAMLLPYLSVTVRRLHDTDRSGWWLLIGFIPLIGSIILFIFMCQDSTRSLNQYGENPKRL
ncbi:MULTISPECIES: DUF805 domain-containing protein [unclassified Gilliamella]|uniref:DUF805 domain-containing protein n=1 Tax=unclassified Gilliamella TaxID=2685620 RepID=UPI00080DE67D|nr:DUF805 domain-containing protein [Gilliamella apicola]OCG18375.1 aminopeptidase [Gilliamella apicola]OCG25617.1 aminopeptidase [Gilliamella apicola]